MREEPVKLLRLAKIPPEPSRDEEESVSRVYPLLAVFILQEVDTLHKHLSWLP